MCFRHENYVYQFRNQVKTITKGKKTNETTRPDPALCHTAVSKN